MARLDQSLGILIFMSLQTWQSVDKCVFWCNANYLWRLTWTHCFALELYHIDQLSVGLNTWFKHFRICNEIKNIFLQLFSHARKAQLNGRMAFRKGNQYEHNFKETSEIIWTLSRDAAVRRSCWGRKIGPKIEQRKNRPWIGTVCHRGVIKHWLSFVEYVLLRHLCSALSR